MEALHSIHLKVYGQAATKDIGYGYGCDYRWNDDYTAFRFLPNRWMPGSDESYAAYQAGDGFEYTIEERYTAEEIAIIEATSVDNLLIDLQNEARDDDDEIPF